MKLVPLGDRVVLKQLIAEETTKSGIVLPGQEKEKPQQAEVIAVGPGTEDVKMEVEVGDKIIVSKYSGTEVKLDDDKFIIVKQEDTSEETSNGTQQVDLKNTVGRNRDGEDKQLNSGLQNFNPPKE